MRRAIKKKMHLVDIDSTKQFSQTFLQSCKHMPTQFQFQELSHFNVASVCLKTDRSHSLSCLLYRQSLHILVSLRGYTIYCIFYSNYIYYESQQ